MARRRTLVLMPAGADASGSPSALGDLHDVLAALADFNTAPDGSGASGMGETPGIGVLHGPGFRVEIPVSAGATNGQSHGSRGEPVVQAIVTLTDEDFAFPVLIKLCRRHKWKMLDAESGLSFGG